MLRYRPPHHAGSIYHNVADLRVDQDRRTRLSIGGIIVTLTAGWWKWGLHCKHNLESPGLGSGLEAV